MEISLAKGGFCQIGSVMLNPVNEGPEPIDIKELTPQQRNQLLYNLNRGVLVTDKASFNELKEICTAEAAPMASNKIATPAQRPANKETGSMISQEAVDKENNEIRKILSGNVASIKREITDMSIGRIRRLLTAEQNNKKRKSLIEYMEKTIKALSKEVTETVGNIDISKKGPLSQAEIMKELGPSFHNVSEVVESEIEQVTFNLPAEDE